MNQVVAQNTESLEDTLLIRSWGKWGRPHFVGTKAPGWVKEIISGWRESPKECIPDIDEEYALKLDRLIARMPETRKATLIGLYVYRTPLNQLAKVLHTTKYHVMNERDAALWYLLGALESE